jgi:tight adherence protein B
VIPAGSVFSTCLVAAGLAATWPTGGSRDRLAQRPHRQFVRPTFDLGAARQQLEERPRRSVVLIALALAVIAGLVGGMVAALLGAVYGALAARALVRRSARRRAAAMRDRTLDDLGALAADLRAGLPPVEEAFAASAPAAMAGGAERRIAELTSAVWRLAERTGAPAADLVDRIEADARTADRAHALAGAQAAGAQATAVILTGLPIGGILLGYGIGVAPVPILLHTALGGACALGATALQVLGLLWAERLTAGAAR